MVKISAPEKKRSSPKKGDQPDTRLGLPQLTMVYKDAGRGKPTWDKLEESGIPMGYDVVVYPMVGDDTLDVIYVNMDSNIMLSHRAKLTKEETIATVEKRYVSAVYFHTLFLYTITMNRKYGMVKTSGDGREEPVEVTEYIKDLFENFYTEFLLNFDTHELIAALEA